MEGLPCSDRDQKSHMRVPDVSGSLDRKYPLKRSEESWIRTVQNALWVLCVYVCMEGHIGLLKENVILSWLNFYYYKEQKEQWNQRPHF